MGHAGSATGFARVLHSILRHLPPRWNLHHLGINGPAPERSPGWTVHGNGDVARQHSPEMLRDVIAAVRPDLVVVLDEPWVAVPLAPALRGGDFATVFYGAIDGEESVTPEIAGELARLDCFVAFTACGRAIAERAGVSTRIEVIPHGVDADVFHPVDKIAARREVFGTRDLDDAFVILNANRNQPFKRIDLTLEAFALFARDKRDARLCLHMGTRRLAPGEVPLADRLRIRDQLLLTEKSERHPSVTSERLNLVYNACDVGVNTSEKEGWGLIAFEHAATRAAQVVPRHSACAELWEGAALLVEPTTENSPGGYRKRGQSVTIEGVAAAFERLYRDRDERERLADAAYARATAPEYAWRNIALQWDALFADLLRMPSSTSFLF